MANDRSSSTRENEVQESQESDTNKEIRTSKDVRKEETAGFSFRHFLNTSSDSPAASSPSNSNGPVGTSGSSTKSLRSLPVNSSPPPSSSSGTGSPLSSQQLPNLGARPKVPQYSLHNNNSSQQQLEQHHQMLPRMKRSPKFPSFDSHASLSEYSEEVSSNFVQRSHSNYEVETPSATTFNRRSPICTTQNNSTSSNIPATSNSPLSSSSTSVTGNRNTSEFQSALPDFVKDHMVLEQWYQTNPFRSAGDANNEHSTGSPPSSPPPTANHFNDLESSSRRNYHHHHNSNLFDLALGSAGVGTSSSSSSSTFRLTTNNSPTVPMDLPPANERIQIPLDLPHHRFNAHQPSLNNNNNNNNNPSSVGDLPLDLTELHRMGNSRNDLLGGHHQQRNAESSPPPQVQADMMQTLPDFLSDGPIHSSGRLADVAQDLPQLDSPEENAAVNVISRLRLENDRLRHELDEARRLISDQGRQINDLERSCRNGEIQRNGTVLERNKLNQKISQLTVGLNEWIGEI